MSKMLLEITILVYFVGLAAQSAFCENGQRLTTLHTPEAFFEVVADDAVTIQWGKLAARLVNNQAISAEHLPGYNGILEVRYDGGPSPFVPKFAGLNLEHVNNGVIYEDRELQFEPRRHPMQIRRINDRTYELYQAPLPNTGLESCTRFEFAEPYFIDVTFECVPRLEKFPYGYLNVFWASYILAPEDKSIYFLGRRKGESSEHWIRGVTPSHGELSTHRGARDKHEYRHEDPFPLTLVFNESDYEYTQPFYYGRFREFVWIVLFHEQDLIRFTQSPSGGGDGNPAWDFQWFIRNPEKDKLYRLSYRAIYKPWVDRNDILQEYERFRRDD